MSRIDPNALAASAISEFRAHDAHSQMKKISRAITMRSTMGFSMTFVTTRRPWSKGRCGARGFDTR